MATMDKVNTIFGERRQITPLGFTTSHLNEIERLIQSVLGAEWKLKRAEVTKAVEAARKDPLLKDGYVKVGLVTGHMVMRFKEKKGDGKHFTDLILVKDYKTKAAGKLPGTGSASKLDENWGALSVGNMKQEDAEQALSAREDGAWFVRHGLGNALTVSLRQGGVVTHVPVAEAAALNLDYNRRLTAQLLNLTRLDPLRQSELEALPGFFARLDRLAAERLLSTKPANAWLIRASMRSDEVAWSRKTPERVEHYAIRDDKGFQNFTAYRQRYPELQVTG